MCLGRHCHRKPDCGERTGFNVGDRGAIRFQYLAEPARYHQCCFGDVSTACESSCDLDRLASIDGLRDTPRRPCEMCGPAFAGWWLPPAIWQFGFVLGCNCAKGEQQQGDGSKGDDQTTARGHGASLDVVRRRCEAVDIV